jgi:hypothetical protein
MASRSLLPRYAHSSVPTRWLAFGRAGLSGWCAPASLGALIFDPFCVLCPPVSGNSKFLTCYISFIVPTITIEDIYSCHLFNYFPVNELQIKDIGVNTLPTSRRVAIYEPGANK